MSRVGKNPISIPSGVKCDLKGSHLTVTGPKGTLQIDVRPEIEISIDGDVLVAKRPDEKPQTRAYHGLTRALINNMIVGVTDGYSRKLLIEGVGYRVAMEGKGINVQVGHSHKVVFNPPEGVTLAVDGTTTIVVSGADKQAVGQAAAKIRAIRKPEPYKGKGIRYENEHIRRKEGKAGGK